MRISGAPTRSKKRKPSKSKNSTDYIRSDKGKGENQHLYRVVSIQCMPANCTIGHLFITKPTFQLDVVTPFTTEGYLWIHRQNLGHSPTIQTCKIEK